MSSRLVSLVFLGCLLGCSNKVDSNPAPDPLATSDGFCHAWAADACNDTVVSACSGSSTPTDSLRTACQLSQETFCVLRLPATGYGSAHAAECLSAITNAYADGKLTAAEAATVRDLAAPCDRLIKGPSADGDGCTVNDDCDTIAGSICIMKGGLGKCGVPNAVGNGTSCAAADAVCGAGFYCDTSMHCISQQSLGQACANQDECATGLVCTNLVCVMKTAPTACTVNGDCVTGKACEIATGSTTGSCVDQIILTPTESLCQDLK